MLYVNKKKIHQNHLIHKFIVVKAKFKFTPYIFMYMG